LFHPIKNNYFQIDFDDNVVFANQDDKYQILVSDLLGKISKGQPAIHTNTYTVTPQKFYNITESYDVDIMWVYNAGCSEWYNSLSDDVKKFISDNNNQFHNFPYYKTFLQNPPEIIDLSPEQVNLIADLSSWLLISNEKLIKDFLNKTENNPA
jgi:hypothetical protein